jgi:hypothetical protein
MVLKSRALGYFNSLFFYPLGLILHLYPIHAYICKTSRLQQNDHFKILVSLNDHFKIIVSLNDHFKILVSLNDHFKILVSLNDHFKILVSLNDHLKFGHESELFCHIDFSSNTVLRIRNVYPCRLQIQEFFIISALT